MTNLMTPQRYTMVDLHDLEELKKAYRVEDIYFTIFRNFSASFLLYLALSPSCQDIESCHIHTPDL